MFLKPIEKPKSFTMKLTYWFAKLLFGKVPTTTKVLYARRPFLMKPILLFGKLDKKLHLNADLVTMLRFRIATQNGCSFCQDFSRFSAKKNQQLMQKLGEVPNYQDSFLLSKREKLALDFVSKASNFQKIDDQTMLMMRRHFLEEEIVELVWINATENYLNLTTIPLGIGSDGLCRVPMNRKPRNKGIV